MLEIIKNTVNHTLEGSSYFLVELIQTNQKINVFLDGYNGVPLKICTKVNRNIRRAAEDNEIINELNVEVSSPGLDRPLVLEKQYASNVGRLVNLLTTEKEHLTGRLVYFDYKKVKLQTENKSYEVVDLSLIEKLTIQVDINF